MSLTFSDARDQICSILATAWQETTFPMLWQDKPEKKPSGRVPWARTTIRHVSGGQSTLANVFGVARFKRDGIVVVQIFTPSGEGLSRAYDLGKVITDAFDRGSVPDGVWFTNARLSEIGPDGDWYQMNVTAEFTYDEIK